jgi:hypothetical protein
MRKILVALIAAFVAGPLSPAAAQTQIASAYTPLDLDK